MRGRLQSGSGRWWLAAGALLSATATTTWVGCATSPTADTTGLTVLDASEPEHKPGRDGNDIIDDNDAQFVDGAVDEPDDTVDSAPPPDSGTLPDSTVQDAGEDGSVDPVDAFVDTGPLYDAGPGSTTIVVLRVGDGVTSLSTAAAAAFLETRSTVTGGVTATIPLPTAASLSNQPFTVTGSASYDGDLQRSGDHAYLTVPGYAAAPGTAAVQATASATVPRVIAVINAAGDVDTRTTLGTFFSANNVRSAYTSNGSDLWVTGFDPGGAFFYTSVGATTPVRLVTTPTSGRSVGAFDGQLYGTSGSASYTGLFTIGGASLPIAATTAATPPLAAGASPDGFFMIDTDGTPGVDRLYLADDSAIASGGGLKRLAWNGTSWNLTSVIHGGLTSGVRHVTGELSAWGVLLYVTTAESPTRVGTFLDDGVHAPTFVPLASAPANTAFRGVALPAE